MNVFERRQAARMAMRGVPERLGLQFAQGNIEMRSRPNGTAAGSAFEFSGYATVYGAWFDMWDQNGEPYLEQVAPGACKRSLANPNLDVPFLIGHNDAGIPLARTKSGTMTLAEDSRGLQVHVPSMDGRREEVRALASAVERGDMDEMSLAFVCLTPAEQQWDADYERRTIRDMELHRGDVCAVTHGANPATAGSWMMPVEQLSLRRPAAIGGPVLLERRRERRMPTAPYSRGADEHVTCAQCRSGNDADAAYCDQCGTELNPLIGYMEHPDDTQVCPWCRCMNGPDAKVCDQCGRGMVNDHDDDDPGYAGGAWMADYYATRRPLERRAAMSTADINDLPDSAFAYIEPGGSKDSEGKTTPRSKRHFPINDAAHVRNALSRAPQSPFGAKALPAIKAAAKRMGIGEDEQRALMQPLERRASAGDAVAAPDFDAAAAGHDVMTGSHSHPHYHDDGEMMTHEHSHDNDADHSCGQSANVMVDDTTGIPGEEVQFSAALARERRVRELELEELAVHGR